MTMGFVIKTVGNDKKYIQFPELKTGTLYRVHSCSNGDYVGELCIVKFDKGDKIAIWLGRHLNDFYKDDKCTSCEFEEMPKGTELVLN